MVMMTKTKNMLKPLTSLQILRGVKGVNEIAREIGLGKTTLYNRIESGYWSQSEKQALSDMALEVLKKWNKEANL